MGSALWKDTLREIRHSFGRFISILVIIALGVGFFVGIKCASPSMLKTAEHYFQTQELMDFKLQSTVGFDSEDLQSIAQTDHIAGIMPSYEADVVLRLENRNTTVKVMALPQQDSNYPQLNRAVLVQGNLPQAENECVVSYSSAVNESIAIGDTVQFAQTAGEQQLSEILIGDTYTVVGFVESPMYITADMGKSTVGDGTVFCFFMLPEQSFVYEKYTAVYLQTDLSTQGISPYSDEYKDAMPKIAEKLEKLGKERVEIFKEQAEKTYAEQLAANAAFMGGYALPVQAQPMPEIEAQWYVFDREDNPGYGDFETDTQRVDAVATVFPVFFIAVVLLVTLSTMTRMVEDKRIEIGTLKALGYSSGAIAGKFFIYSFLAGMIGCVLGLLVGIFLFPALIYTAYGAMYPSLPELIYDVPWLYPFLAVITAVLCTSFVSIIACYNSLRVNPSALMRPKAPKPGKRILLERMGFLWRHFSFTSKVTARNLFRYKIRFFMTVLGVAGCTALIIAALGLNDSVSVIGQKQFVDITHYNTTLVYDKEKTEQETEQIEGFLDRNDYTKKHLSLSMQTVTPHNADDFETMDAYLVVPKDNDAFTEYIELRNRISGEKLQLQETGVVITEKIAMKLGLHTGDSVAFRAGEDEYAATVTGITENYAFHYIYMPKQVYAQIFGKEVTYTNAYVIVPDLNDDSKSEIAGELLANDEIMALSYNDKIIDQFNQTITSMQAIVIVIVFTAGALAFVVLYNLTNINIEERVREIATIKVLGFNTKETIGYVFRENILLTLLGIAAGVGLGTVMTDYIVRIVELDLVMFGRGISWASYVGSVLITLAFALLVMVVMFFKVRRIDMIESLKANE